MTQCEVCAKADKCVSYSGSQDFYCKDFRFNDYDDMNPNSEDWEDADFDEGFF